MRIVYICEYFSTRAMSGSTRAYEQARRLVECGHDVHVVTSDTKAARLGATWRVSVEDGVHVHWLSVPYSNSMSYRRRILAFLYFAVFASVKASWLGGDVVFASSTPLTVTIPGVIAARLRRARFVFEVRDLWPEIPIEMGALRRPAEIRLAFALAEMAYRRADHVVALSEGMAKGIAAHGYPASRISIVPNACDLDLFAVNEQEAQRFRRSRPWLQERPLVVYLGAFGKVNGLGYLVRVAAEMSTLDPEVRFLFVGEGGELPEVARLATELGVLDANLFLMPKVPKNEVPAILGAATIATSVTIPVPGLAANSANKFFDALAAGRPQAINYGGWQADVLRESGAGLVLDPHDTAQAARDLAVGLRDEGWLSAARTAAQRLAVQRYSRDELFAVLARAVLGDDHESSPTHRSTAADEHP